MSDKFIEYQDAKIHYADTGEGDTVMLVHGFAEDGTVWKHQVEFLQKYFRVIVPDIPGSGESAYIPGLNIDSYAEVLKLVFKDALDFPGQGNDKKISMIGHSMGGYATLAFAEKYPDLLSSFGLFHSSAFADTAEKKQVRFKAIDFIKANGTDQFLKTSTPGLFTKEFAEKNPGKIEQLVAIGNKCSAEALIQYYQAMMQRPDRTAVLKSFPNPVLFLIGEKDNAVPLDISLKQCYFPQESNIHILENAAHMGMWEEIDESNTILLKFLQQVLMHTDL